MAKEATRGQKQILEENKSTISWYMKMSFVTMVVYLFFMTFMFSESFTALYISLSILSSLVYGTCIATMNYMARPVYSETGGLLDGGLDLNMKGGGGVSEYLKDLIILTSLTQLLSLFSNWFWWLLLAVPGYATYLFWVNIAAPWIFAPAPEVDQEREDKKQRKLDRRMRRVQ
jgi:hypothetical protein